MEYIKLSYHHLNFEDRTYFTNKVRRSVKSKRGIFIIPCFFICPPGADNGSDYAVSQWPYRDWRKRAGYPHGSAGIPRQKRCATHPPAAVVMRLPVQ